MYLSSICNPPVYPIRVGGIQFTLISPEPEVGSEQGLDCGAVRLGSMVGPTFLPSLKRNLRSVLLRPLKRELKANCKSASLSVTVMWSVTLTPSTITTFGFPSSQHFSHESVPSVCVMHFVSPDGSA